MASIPEDKLLIINEDHNGLHLISGPPTVNTIQTICSRTRAMTVSKDGDYIAFADEKGEVSMVDLNDRQFKFTQNLAGVLFMGLSPLNNYLQVWMHTKNPTDHNLIVYDVKNNTKVQSMKQKQSQWKLHWTDNESLCVRFFNEELLFYEKNDFDRYVAKFHTQKVADFSLATNLKSGDHYFACLSLGTRGQPNFVRLYCYPEMKNAIASKSFFRTDRATFKWRSRGDAVLILCASDVDTTGKSYYGEQNLNYMDVKGKAFAVALDKDGPVHAVEWHPSTNESLFCVSYGFVPPKIAFIDTDCRVIHTFDGMHINQIHFNPFGNLIIFAGFGNLRGGLSVYNTETKELLATVVSPDTTFIAWAPDGVHLLTAVTSPRMRVGNCLRIWHYTGKLIKEFVYPDGDCLFRSIWRPNHKDFPTAPKIMETGIKANQSGTEAAALARYVPPHLRKSGAIFSSSTADETNALPSKAPRGRGGGKRSRGGGDRGDRHGKGSTRGARGARGGSTDGGNAVAAIAETNDNKDDAGAKERKIKTIEKKIQAITKLKSIRDSGGQLEKNQLSKIAKEKELLAELEKMQLKE